MLFHEYECSTDGTSCISNIYVLKEVDSLANYSLLTSSDKF